MKSRKARNITTFHAQDLVDDTVHFNKFCIHFYGKFLPVLKIYTFNSKTCIQLYTYFVVRNKCK